MPLVEEEVLFFAEHLTAGSLAGPCPSRSESQKEYFCLPNLEGGGSQAAGCTCFCLGANNFWRSFKEEVPDTEREWAR